MKQKRPVLYELMREQRSSAAIPTTNGRIHHIDPLPQHFASDDDDLPPAPAPAPIVATLPRPFGIPIGYILIGFAALLIIGLAAYLMGHSRGQEDAAPDRGALQAGLEEDGFGGPAGGGVGNESGNARTGAAGSTGGASSSTARRTAGPIESNPRENGKNYFVIVQTSRQNAIRVAEFCRQRGLEAYVDRVNNADFRVFLLPGFTAEERSSPQVAAFEQRIEEVKAAWNEAVGKKDLGLHIAVKYRG